MTPAASESMHVKILGRCQVHTGYSVILPFSDPPPNFSPAASSLIHILHFSLHSATAELKPNSDVILFVVMLYWFPNLLLDKAHVPKYNIQIPSVTISPASSPTTFCLLTNTMQFKPQ